MKTTDLQAFGLTEMNEAEMRQTEGGWILEFWEVLYHLTKSNIKNLATLGTDAEIAAMQYN